MTEDQRKTVMAMAQGQLRVMRAAEILYMSETGTIYRIDKSKRDYGLDARDFFDLCKLLEMAKEDERE